MSGVRKKCGDSRNSRPTMTSTNNQPGCDQESPSRLQQQLEQQHHYHHDDGDYSDDDYQAMPSRFDPCQAYTNETCMDACQTMSTINNVAMCGGVFDSDRLSRFHNYFNSNNVGEGLEDHASPYLYSSNAPIGPRSCEYCGRRSTKDCPSDLPRECMLPNNPAGSHNGVQNIDKSLFGRSASNSNSNNVKNHAEKKDPNNQNDGKATPARDAAAEVCHRPKLFFLKKRPPFATPDGWDPVTEHRVNLFEPPSSMEGMGRGWGEVRGHLGGGHSNAAGGGGGAGGNANRLNGNLNRSYQSCASSACGADTEVSFSSATHGGDRGTSDGSGSLLPVHWVSGLMGALSPS